MYTLTDKQLEDIKTLGSYYFTPVQIHLMLSLPEDYKDAFIDNCINDKESKAFKAYQGGKLEQELLLRKAVFVAAKQGSPIAKKMADKIIIDAKYKERHG